MAISAPKPAIWGNHKLDWCHFCGRRGTFFFTEMEVPENAEHGTTSDGFYVRLCSTCVGKLAAEIQRQRRDQ